MREERTTVRWRYDLDFNTSPGRRITHTNDHWNGRPGLFVQFTAPENGKILIVFQRLTLQGRYLKDVKSAVDSRLREQSLRNGLFHQ